MGTIRCIYFGIGSNIGDRMMHLEQSIRALKANFGPIQQLSSVYETKAWGLEDQADFLNQVVVFRSAKSPRVVLERILIIEKKLGRIRKKRWGPRNIDIDILICDDLIVNQKGLTIPHPRMQERNFVMVPLVELAPRLIHPILDKTMQELLDDCPDKQTVHKYQG